MILNISDQDMKVIETALLEMKLKDSYLTFVNLKTQVELQTQPKLDEKGNKNANA